MKDDVSQLTWAELSALLLRLSDEKRLQRMLAQVLDQGGPRNRALRIHGRLSRVRRQREMQHIEEVLGGQRNESEAGG